MRPSHLHGSPVRPTRDSVCHFRPSTSQGIFTVLPTSVISRSPCFSCSCCCGSYFWRSANGPANNTGASAAAVWEYRPLSLGSGAGGGVEGFFFALDFVSLPADEDVCCHAR